MCYITSAKDRLMQSVCITDSGCWEWNRGRSPKGYGQFSFKGVSRRAHRVAFELFNGKIPRGAWILHTCDNPPCCNPEHLKIGDHEKNVADKVARHRQSHPEGELHPCHKLTASEVLAIRSSKNESRRVLAGRHGVSMQTISDIRARRSWAHL